MEANINENGFYFWKRVDQVRSGIGLSLSQLASRCSSTYSSIRSQRSTNTIPKARVIVELAQVLGTTTDYLLVGVDGSINDNSDPLYSTLESRPEIKSLVQKMLLLTSKQLAAITAVVDSCAPETGKQQHVE